MVAGVDDEDFPEVGRQFLVVAQEVDDVADRPVIGHRDQLALHQAAGGFLRVGQRLLDRGAIVGVQRAQHRALVRFLHVLDDRDGVVGIEFGGEVGDLRRGQRVDQVFANVIVHLGEDVAVEQVLERLGEAAAILVRGQLEQVGDIGGVERFDQRARRLVVAVGDRVEHRADEFGTQTIVLVQLVLFGDGGVGQFGLAHRCSFPIRPAGCCGGARLPRCGTNGHPRAFALRRLRY